MYTSAFTITDLAPELRFLFSVWKSASDGEDFPRLTKLGLPNADNAPNILSVYEIERSDTGEPIDFKALYARSKLSRTLYSKFVGTRLSEHPGKGPGSKMWSCFVEVAASSQPLLVSLPYIGPLPNYQSTSEIYLPLLGEKTSVEYVLVGVVLLETEYRQS